MTSISRTTTQQGEQARQGRQKEPAKDETTRPLAGPIATIRPHAYTLSECLSLSERNHPNLWAARARLAFVHAQLDEARWTPFSYWSANATTGVLPTIGGTPFYNAVPRSVAEPGLRRRTSSRS